MGTQSPPYPDPLFAGNIYGEPVATALRTTGNRRSQVQPLVRSASAFTQINDWNTARVRVSVLDTGFDVVGDGANLNRRNLAFDPIAGAEIADDDANRLLDPVAGHGTFIAGIISALAPHAAIRVYRVLKPEGDGDESCIANTIDLALSEARGKEHVISLSFGTYTLDTPGVLADAMKRAQQQNAVVVASAGNDGICRPAFPAAFVGVIGVGALGPEGPADFSNYGPWVRACAPGVDIAAPFFYSDGTWSIDPTSDTRAFHGWGMWSGTSFSAPIVAAVLARTAAEFNESVGSAVTRVVDDPQRMRLSGYGTVVNESPKWR